MAPISSSAACNIRNSLPLNDKEVVITFDDGPLPPYTDQVLDILAAQCVKATFFMVGEMAHSFPATVRRVYEEGHTIGTHSDHHPVGFGKLPLERMHQEIDGGIADVSAAFGGDPRYLAPFFRIPGLERSDVLESELAQRGLIIFSADVVADDWHRDITPAKIISLAMSCLESAAKAFCCSTTFIRRRLPRCRACSNNSRSRATTSCKWCPPRPTSSRWRAGPL